MPFHSKRKTVRERITELFFDYASAYKGKTFDNICKVVIPLSVIKAKLNDIPESTINYNVMNKKCFRRVYLGTAQAFQIVPNNEKAVIKPRKRTAKQKKEDRKKFDDIRKMAELRKRIVVNGWMKIFNKRINEAVLRAVPHFEALNGEK